MARLKVFQARLGFHDSVVAATSRPKALAAWGVRQDLFAEGMADETDDPEAVAAAVAQPETPLLRPVGGKGRFEARPAGPPRLPKEARSRQAGSRRAPTRTPRAKPPPPDRSRLDAAEDAVAALEAERRELKARFEARRKALAEEAQAARKDLAARQTEARQALTEARAAFRKAGGKP